MLQITLAIGLGQSFLQRSARNFVTSIWSGTICSFLLGAAISIVLAHTYFAQTFELPFQGKENSTGFLKWMDGSPASFQAWKQVRISDFTLTKGSSEILFQDTESLLQPMNLQEKLCTTFVIFSNVEMHWATVLCDRSFSDVLVICQRQILNHNDSATVAVISINRYYTECDYDWVTLGASCHQAIDMQGETSLRCSELEQVCQGYGAMLTAIPSYKQMAQMSLFFQTWLSNAEGTLLFRKAQGGSLRCSAMQFKQRYYPALSETHMGNNGSVVCERDPIIISLNCSYKYFQCSDGTCILSHYECDGISDCPDGSDEWECSHVCTFTRGEVPQLFSCFSDCLPSHCVCHDLYYQCGISGTCVPASRLCDGVRDCLEGEDEAVCPWHQTQSPSPPGAEATFKCSGGTTIPISLVNDLVPDCPGSIQDDETLLSVFLLNRTLYRDTSFQTCPPVYTSCIKDFPLKCYPRNRVCTFEIDVNTKQLKYCRNGAHLSSCSTHVCPSMYKCKKSYCIPFHYVCNGRIDCPHGEEEIGCETLRCPGLLKCRQDDVCVHPNFVGNGEVDCLSSTDDEELLRSEKCPEGCTCLGYAMKCSFMTSIPYLSTVMRKLVLVENTFSGEVLLNFPSVLYLDLSRNGITRLTPGMFRVLSSIIHLSLAENDMRRLRTKQFGGMTKLNVLELQINPVSYIERYAFSGLGTLELLNLSYLHLDTIVKDTFGDLNRLLYLDISHNYIKQLAPNALRGIESNLESLNLIGNPVHDIAFDSLKVMHRLALFYSDSERNCLLLLQKVHCHFSVEYNIPCCRMISNLVSHIVWIVYVISISPHLLSIMYWATRTRQVLHRLLAIVTNLLSFVLAYHAFYVITLNIVYGETFAYYRPLILNKFHCIGTGLFIYFNRHSCLTFLALAAYSRFEAVIKPFKYQQKSLRWYIIIAGCILMLLTISCLIPLALLGPSLMAIGSACLIYPVCHKVLGWQYMVALYISLDMCLHWIVISLSFMTAWKIRASTSLANRNVSKMKMRAIKRGLVFGSAQTGSLLVSLLVHILAITLEFGDAEMMAASVAFTLQSLISPVCFTFSSTSFQNWILRR